MLQGKSHHAREYVDEQKAQEEEHRFFHVRSGPQLRQPRDAELRQDPEQQRAKEHEVDDRRNQRQHQLKYKNVRKRDPAERSVFWPEKRVAVLPEGLQRAEGPAETLADELPGCFRSFRPGDGLFVVADAPTEAADRNGQIGVFGHGVRSDAARGFYRFLAPRTERSGHDGNAIQEVKRALLHVLAGDVLQRLPARQPARAVADLHIARDRANLGIRKVADQVANGVRLNFRVRVDGHHNFSIHQQGHGVAQRRRFSTIHLVNDVDTRLMRKVCIQQLACFVR